MLTVGSMPADVEFGRLQARDLLQHLWTGPISNAPVDIVQGSKSVEVRPVGVSKVNPGGPSPKWGPAEAAACAALQDGTAVLVAAHAVAMAFKQRPKTAPSAVLMQCSASVTQQGALMEPVFRAHL